MSIKELMEIDVANEQWQEAVASLQVSGIRPEILIEEVPAPARLAPFSAALAVDAVNADDEDLASGRFVVLHDPDGQPTWDGTFRIVTFVKAPIESDVVTDDIFDEVAWSWLTECLTDNNVEYHHLSGTVTRTVSRSFADLKERKDESDLEIRASWTANSQDLSHHFLGWLQLVETCAGLQPIPPGVPAIARTS